MTQEARLLERDAEVEALVSRLEPLVASGTGGVVLVEGVAGIGKSSLLRALVGAALERPGLRVLTARGTELELELAFGAVRRLFAPVVTLDEVERDRVLSGPASLAAAVLGLRELPRRARRPALRAVVAGDEPRGDRTAGDGDRRRALARRRVGPLRGLSGAARGGPAGAGHRQRAPARARGDGEPAGYVPGHRVDRVAAAAQRGGGRGGGRRRGRSGGRAPRDRRQSLPACRVGAGARALAGRRARRDPDACCCAVRSAPRQPDLARRHSARERRRGVPRGGGARRCRARL